MGLLCSPFYQQKPLWFLTRALHSLYSLIRISLQCLLMSQTISFNYSRLFSRRQFQCFRNKASNRFSLECISIWNYESNESVNRPKTQCSRCWLEITPLINLNLSNTPDSHFLDNPHLLASLMESEDPLISFVPLSQWRGRNGSQLPPSLLSLLFSAGARFRGGFIR